MLPTTLVAKIVMIFYLLPHLICSLTAQDPIFPKPYYFVEAPDSLQLFDNGYRHFQLLFTRSSITSPSGFGLEYPCQVNGVKFRIEGGASGGNSGTIPNVTVSMSSVTFSPAGMSNTFAANRGPDFTQVYQGAISLTPGGTQSPNSNLVTITFTTPFAYDPTSGSPLPSLLLEIEYQGGVGLVLPVCDGASSSISAVSTNHRGMSTTTIGAATGTAMPFFPVTELDFVEPVGVARRMVLGRGCGATPTTPLTLSTSILSSTARPILGTSFPYSTSFITPTTFITALFLSLPGYPAGIEFLPAAPGCYYFVGNLDVVYVVPSAFPSEVLLNIPNDPTWLGLEIFGQSVSLDPAAPNPMGIYTSNGYWLRVGNF